MTTAPPSGYDYAVIQTVDTNTGEMIWIVYAKPIWWREQWKALIGTGLTTVVGLLGWVFKSEIGRMIFKGKE